MRSVHFVPAAWDEYLWWQGQDKKTLNKRINTLINAAGRAPFGGIGKPEPLVGNLSGYWSRRIDEANRLVYRATDDELVMPGAKKPDQSVGRGVKTTLSPSRRMNTSRTDLGKRYSSGIVTVCERLFHPTRAVGLGVEV